MLLIKKYFKEKISINNSQNIVQNWNKFRMDLSSQRSCTNLFECKSGHDVKSEPPSKKHAGHAWLVSFLRIKFFSRNFKNWWFLWYFYDFIKLQDSEHLSIKLIVVMMNREERNLYVVEEHIRPFIIFFIKKIAAICTLLPHSCLATVKKYEII